MHQARANKAEMKKAVLDVKDIIKSLPAGRDAEIQKDFQSVYELVTRVVDKQQNPKPEKPSLNTEGLDDF